MEDVVNLVARLTLNLRIEAKKQERKDNAAQCMREKRAREKVAILKLADETCTTITEQERHDAATYKKALEAAKQYQKEEKVKQARITQRQKKQRIAEEQAMLRADTPSSSTNTSPATSPSIAMLQRDDEPIVPVAVAVALVIPMEKRDSLPRAVKIQKYYGEGDVISNHWTTTVEVPGVGKTLWSTCHIPAGTKVAKYQYQIVSKQQQNEYIFYNLTNADKCVTVKVDGEDIYLIGNQRGGARGVLASNACLCVSNSQFAYSVKDGKLDICWLETTKAVGEGKELTWCYGCPWDWTKDDGKRSRLYMKNYVCPMVEKNRCRYKAYEDELKLPPQERSTKFMYPIH